MNETLTKFVDTPFGDQYGPYLSGPFAPTNTEVTLVSFDGAGQMEGEIPKELNGVYLRNGPNPRFAPLGRYHAFDGDGMLHAAYFNNGKLQYRNRWIRTHAWEQEDAAGASLYRGIMDTLKGRDDQPLKNSANTDIVGHAGKAVASWYQSGEPYWIDPLTLQTLGRAPYAGLGGGFSAHCKVDEHTGEMMFFDYCNNAPYMSYGVIDNAGNQVLLLPVSVPGPRLPHDMAITQHFSILHDLPLIHCEEALKHGRHKIKFEPALPTRLGVIPRHGPASALRWFDFSPCFIYHVINAWEEGDDVVMVGCRYMPRKTPDGEIDAQATANDIAQLRMNARLWEWRMNLATGTATERCLNNALNVEFPGINLRYQGRKNRWAYLVDHDPKALHWTGLRKFDLQTGACTGAWTDDPVNAWYSEPWFAPRSGDTIDAVRQAEDDGYVILFCWNEASRVQQLQIFDAQDISRGPVTRITLPVRVPSGFHACWIQNGGYAPFLDEL